MNKKKNASLDFSFYPEDYPDVSLSFNCSEDLTCEEVVDFFERFLVAMGYGDESIKKYLNEK